MPAYGGRSLPNVMASVARALGHPLGEDRLPPLTAPWDPFEGRRADGPVVLTLVDGLGLASLLRAGRARPGTAVESWGSRSVPMTTVFPSSTPVAIESVSSACAPSRHGLTGYRAYLPHFGSVVELLHMAPLGVSRENALAGPDGQVSGVFGTSTVFRAGVRATSLSRDRFENSAFTRAIYDGADYVPYATFSDLAHELRRTLAADTPPRLVLVYWDELDMAMHLRGPSPDLTAFEVDRLSALFSWVARGLPAGRARSTRVLLTADHGLVEARAEAQIAVDADPELLGSIARPPAGDRRAAFFQARDGALEALRSGLVRRLDGRGTVLDVPEAIAAGLFGPPPYHPELSERIGQLIVLPEPPGGVGYRLPGQPPARRLLRGAHGGLHAEEFLIPLVHGSLEELAARP